MLNVVICGAAGRMGRQNINVFHTDKDVNIVGAIEIKQSSYIGRDAGIVAGIDKIDIKITSDLEEVIEKSQVIVDFTNPESTLYHLTRAKKFRKAIVIGTTGFTENHISIIKEYSKSIPIVLSPNMSQGVNILFHLVKKATQLFGEQYDIEILEIHHNLKKDAPSGTALQLGKIISQARNKNLEDVGRFERHGIIGERKKGEIGISSLRLSDVIGDHSVIFGGPGERIEFTHRSTNRKNYSMGALRAAKFLNGKKRGFFSLSDVLGLS
jgi:4-hydroxy-tetrahydrodipicolinate reductase